MSARLKSASVAPFWLALAEADLGVSEVPGHGANPRILAYWDELGGLKHTSDEIPWCAAFVGACLERSGIRSTRSGMARSYLGWGKRLDRGIPGAIVISARGKPPSGHVSLFLREEGDTIVVLGGNQSDSVSVMKLRRRDVIGYRWPNQDAQDNPQPGERPAAPAHPSAVPPLPPPPAALPAEDPAPAVPETAPASGGPPVPAPAHPRLDDAKASWTVTGALLAYLGALVLWLNDAVTFLVNLAADATGLLGELSPLKALLSGFGVTVPNVGLALTSAGLVLALHRRLFKDAKPR